MKLAVYDMAGAEVSSIELPSSIFEAVVNPSLMHQAVVRQLANARRGTHKAKGRSEVARTTAKMYRQKGTGRARHGSRRAPIFVGGGVAHGPLPRDYSKKMPRKMRRAALRSALTVKASNGDVVLLDQISMDAPKTKEIAQMMQRLVGNNSALLVIPGPDVTVERSARNLADVKALYANYLNVRDVLGHNKLVMSVEALEAVVDFLDVEYEYEYDEEMDEVEETAAESETVVPVDDAPKAKAKKADKGDDLKKIEGIGPKIEGILQEAGITTFAELASTEVSELERILEGNVRMAFPETWPEQAALAAAGKWEELETLQSELEGGRRKDKE